MQAHPFLARSGGRRTCSLNADPGGVHVTAQHHGSSLGHAGRGWVDGVDAAAQRDLQGRFCGMVCTVPSNPLAFGTTESNDEAIAGSGDQPDQCTMAHAVTLAQMSGTVACRAVVGNNGDDGGNEQETDGRIAAEGERNSMSEIANRALRAYRRTLSETLATGQATEHSYRPALQALVEGLGGDGVRAVNEPSHVACGAPDFVIVCGGVPMGHIECKDISAHLNRVEADEQLTRYRAGLPNLILTDYLEFRRYADGDLCETARLGRIDDQGGIIAEKDGTKAVDALFEAFLAADPPKIADPRELAERLAYKARLLRDGIERILGEEGRSGPLRDMLAAYRDILIAGLSDGEFADLQAQTATYGLFAARCLHGPDSQPFTRQSAVFADTTPFLRDMFGRIAGPGIDPRIAWIVDDLALLLGSG